MYKKANGTKRRTSANIREVKVEVSKDELSKLMIVGTELAKEIQEIKKAWGPKPNKDKDKDKDSLAHAKFTLSCASKARRRTGSQQCKKTTFLDVS